MSADEWMCHHNRGLQQQAGSADHPGLGHIIREPFDLTSTRSSSTGCSACSTASTPSAAPSGTDNLVPTRLTIS
jgi:hypothetical protein